jgi:cytoskeletal protein CcmA (bactofilin family)
MGPFRGVNVVLAVVACVVFLFAVTPADAQQAGGTIAIESPVSEDQYLAGGSVTLRTNAAGDVTAAGGRVLIDGEVGGDVNAAGGVVDLFGRVSDDARLAGGMLTVGAGLGGDLVAAGGSVSILRNAVISGRAWLGGGRVQFLGRVGRELKATAGEVVIDGIVGGDAHVTGGRVRVGAAARIAGDFYYRSPREASIDTGARIEGTVRRLPYTELAGPPIGLAIGFLVGLWLVGLIVTGVLLVVVFPSATAHLTATIQGVPGRCALVGFALLAAVPLGAFVCFAILVAMPLGFALSAIYFTALLAAYLTGALWLGERALSRIGGGRADRTWWRAAFLAITLIVLALIGWIPILGWIVVLATVVLGFGALGLQLYQLARSTAPARGNRQ